MLAETYSIFRGNLDEARHHIGHACADASVDHLIAADNALACAIDALRRARKKLGFVPTLKRKSDHEN